MKILIATDSMDIGGAETHVFTLVNELRKKGYRITLISSGGAYEKILKKSGLRCVFAPFNKRDPLSVRKSIKILSHEMKFVDIIHTHTRFTSFLAKKIRGNSSYPGIVTTAHLNFPTFPFGSLSYWGDATLAVSEDIKEHLETKYGIKKDKIFLTKNSVEITNYKKSKLDKRLIIHTSRIDKGRAKTAFLLVDAAEELLRAHNGWRIMIAGDGNLFSLLSKKASEVNRILGFDGIILTGARSDIPALLEYGSIFVGVSRSAIEGMASGIPTIISGDEGYGGIACDDNFSLLSHSNFCARGLKSATKELLKKDLNVLISNPILREELGEALRERVKTYYPSRAMADDALSCYLRVFRPPSVCLMGYFGYQNLGDEETLSCAVQTLISRGIEDISVLCESPRSYHSLPYSVKKYDRGRIDEVCRAIRSCNAFILCGGNLMQNETSTRSLLYYGQAIEYAKRSGKRIYMISSGFGAIHGKTGKILLKRGLKASHFCGCRTNFDLKGAKQYNHNSVIMPDLCFLLSAEKCSCNKDNVFAWIISDKECVSLDEILKISKSRALKPIAVNLFRDKDKLCAEKIKSAGITVITPKDFKALTKILRVSQFSISERLHGAIFSIISHTPTYISENTDKNKALLNEITSRTDSEKIIFPYKENDVIAKKEIGATDSDFNYVIDSLKRDINHALYEIF